MSPSDEHSGRFFEIASGFAGDSNLVATLTRLCHLAVDVVPGCDFAGITLLRGGRPTTAAFTDVASPEIDTAQYETGSGPCMSASRDGVPYTIEDTRLETQWPEFAAAADSHGIRSTLSMPLTVSGTGLGALNMYSSEVNNFSQVDQEATTLFAAQAAAVLANAQAYWAAQELSAQLEEALETRVAIEQAKGMLMFEHKCDADKAFSMLREKSQRANRKLRDIAQETIDAHIT
jgi:GAF domain-containing protein